MPNDPVVSIWNQTTLAPFKKTPSVLLQQPITVQIAKPSIRRNGGWGPGPTHQLRILLDPKSRNNEAARLTTDTAQSDLTNVRRIQPISPRKRASPYAGQSGTSNMLIGMMTTENRRWGIENAVTAAAPRVRATMKLSAEEEMAATS